MRVEIWSDVVCPWSYIGKRRIEAALAQFEHADDVEIVFAWPRRRAATGSMPTG